ncbi:hypothetical protein DBK44_17625 [Salmonella enterica subsp. enterica serovar Typhi]|nr:hypothetical protein DBK44_17625 [Salmonella enterica subsp. enterica serovar Typhi]
MFFMLSPWTWSYIAKIIYYLVSDMRFLLTRRYDEEYVRGNIFNNSPRVVFCYLSSYQGANKTIAM